jgi:hypothetical protein
MTHAKDQTKGSFTAAAKQLGRSLQSVSRSLAALEGDLGVELVARTTRRSAATEAGLAFYRRVGAALSEIEAAKLETAMRSVSLGDCLAFGVLAKECRPQNPCGLKDHLSLRVPLAARCSARLSGRFVGKCHSRSTLWSSRVNQT